jgi:hypothetical protein
MRLADLRKLRLQRPARAAAPPAQSPAVGALAVPRSAAALIDLYTAQLGNVGSVSTALEFWIWPVFRDGNEPPAGAVHGNPYSSGSLLDMTGVLRK